MPLHLQAQPPRLRIKGRSFMAFVLAPEPPIAAWLDALDAHVARAQNFFRGRAVVLDCSAIGPDESGWASLIGDLARRAIPIVDVIGQAAPLPGAEVFARGLVGGRDTGPVHAPGDAGSAAEPPPPANPTPAESSLIVQDPVRSGQTILFPEGDVTILGSVASGAEVFAGGSIHVYGALRGRAQAGAMGNGRARIFCRRLEAELVSIDGFYLVADTMDPAMRGRAVQIRLDSGALIMAALD